VSRKANLVAAPLFRVTKCVKFAFIYLKHGRCRRTVGPCEGVGKFCPAVPYKMAHLVLDLTFVFTSGGDFSGGHLCVVFP